MALWPRRPVSKITAAEGSWVNVWARYPQRRFCAPVRDLARVCRKLLTLDMTKCKWPHNVDIVLRQSSQWPPRDAHRSFQPFARKRELLACIQKVFRSPLRFWPRSGLDFRGIEDLGTPPESVHRTYKGAPGRMVEFKSVGKLRGKRSDAGCAAA